MNFQNFEIYQSQQAAGYSYDWNTIKGWHFIDI